MRRRRFLASVVVLVGLPGCLGSDREPNASGERAGDRTTRSDWEPAPTGSADSPTGTTGATSGTAAGTNEIDGSGGREAANPRTQRDRGDAGERERTDERSDERATAFANGSRWEADRVQVAAADSEAGAAIEFELETTPPERCGRTCRELRAALTNVGTETAHDVAVRTELASDGTVLRERYTDVGDLAVSETYRTTERVELGTLEALRVRRNGAFTVTHVITAAERRAVFRERIET